MGLRRLLFRVGVAVRVALDDGGVAGWFVGSWGRVGEFHIFQWCAFQSGEIVLEGGGCGCVGCFFGWEWQ